MTRTLRLAALAGVLAAAAPAQAQTYGFGCITGNAASSCADGASTLRMGVKPGATPGFVDFTFTNFSASQSSITEIYFDDGSLLGISTVTSSGAGVQFTSIGSGSPDNLPGGKALSPPFVTTAGFLVDIGSGGNLKGVENKLDGSIQEFVTISFQLQSGKTYADTIAALEGPLGDGNDLRVGLHVRGYTMPFGSTMSEAFINNVSPVPEPAGWLAVAMVALAGVALRRRIG